MTTAIRLCAALPLLVLFIDYAVAMQKVEPAGTRRCLRTIAKQTDAGTCPTLRPVWEMGVKWGERV